MKNLWNFVHTLLSVKSFDMPTIPVLRKLKESKKRTPFIMVNTNLKDMVTCGLGHEKQWCGANLFKNNTMDLKKKLARNKKWMNK